MDHLGVNPSMVPDATTMPLEYIASLRLAKPGLFPRSPDCLVSQKHGWTSVSYLLVSNGGDTGTNSNSLPCLLEFPGSSRV